MVKGWWVGVFVGMILMVGDVYLGIGMGRFAVVLALYAGRWYGGVWEGKLSGH